MAKYDGLIIPRSYSDYLNKTDGATLSQMLDSIGGTFDASPTPNSVKPARSGGMFAANAVITSNNATLTGVTISERSVVRVMFTAALTGSDATTGLTLTYNGTAYAVKVGKNGALEALTAHLVEESYIYLQAYTTLELAFDGSQFIVMGNPVVISNADFCIMADGLKTYSVGGTHKYITRQSFSTLSQYNGTNIPEIVRQLGEIETFTDVVMQITAIERKTFKYIKYLYEYDNLGNVYISPLESSQVSINVSNGYGYIDYNGFDSNLDHITVVEVLG